MLLNPSPQIIEVNKAQRKLQHSEASTGAKAITETCYGKLETTAANQAFYFVCRSGNMFIFNKQTQPPQMNAGR